MYGPFELPEGTTWHDLRTPSVASLVLANLIPLAGTLFFGWSSGVILVLYWFETAVIGFYSILKLPFAQRWYALLTVPFFIVHFGAFIGITGFVALGSYLVIDGVEGEGLELLMPIRFELLTFIPAIIVSHGVSFVTNFIGKKEYLLESDEEVLMAKPYMRVLAMFALIFIGALAVGLTRAPVVLMGVFIALKIVVDTIAHLQEHAVASRHRKLTGGHHA